MIIHNRGAAQPDSPGWAVWRSENTQLYMGNMQQQKKLFSLEEESWGQSPAVYRLYRTPRV